MASGRCIFAVGNPEMASIKHLLVNNAAVIAFNKHDIQERIKQIVDNRIDLSSVINNAWHCGKKFHNAIENSRMICLDFEEVVNRNARPANKRSS